MEWNGMQSFCVILQIIQKYTTNRPTERFTYEERQEQP